MSKKEDKAYYRINEGGSNTEAESEASTGKKRSKKKLYTIIGVSVAVVIIVIVLVLVLLFRSSGQIPSGYNGFEEVESVNMGYAFQAFIRRQNNANVPVDFGANNQEFTDVDFHI